MSLLLWFRAHVFGTVSVIPTIALEASSTPIIALEASVS